MKFFYAVVIVSFIGVIASLTNIYFTQNLKNTDTKAIIEMRQPFKSYIAGTGIIEAKSTNIQIASQISGVVNNVYVKVGEKVKKDSPLFSIDDTKLQSELLVAYADLKVFNSLLEKAVHQFNILENLNKATPGFVSKKEFFLSKDDVAYQEAKVELSKEKIKKIEKDLKLYTIYSPMDAEVLESKIRVGEYFDSKKADSKKLILGSKVMSLRVDINEYDAWAVKPNSRAVSFIRGHPKLKIPINFNYIEPHVIPKASFSGLSTERMDTRVLQVIFDITKTNVPIYIGQQLDVFIEK